MVANNNYLYMLGGDTGSGYDDSVTYAAINADGSIGAWAATSSLPSSLSGGAAAVHNGHIYYVGGNDGARSAGVYYATLNADGSVGTWQATTSLPEEREGEGLVEYNGYLFAVGGYNDSAVTDTVYVAPINADGSVGAWTAATSLPAVRTVSGVASYNGFVYNLAGLDVVSALTNTAFYAALTGYTPPTVQHISAVAATGAQTTIDVLQNASDDPDPATLTIVTGPSHGSAGVLAGKITYTSQGGYVGNDSLVYQVCSLTDPSVCSQAILSLQVVPGVPNTGIAPAGRLQSTLFVVAVVLGLGMVGVVCWPKALHLELYVLCQIQSGFCGRPKNRR